MVFFSNFLDITCPVPQGSLLGPLLYMCYSNDMEISVSSRLLLYADDSVLIVSDHNPDVISNKLSADLSSCNEWLIDNKLSLHVGKTECIIFGSKRKLSELREFGVTYGNNEIKGQTSVKYLGVVIDQCLSSETMVNNVISKTIGKLKFLYRYKNCLNQILSKNLCMALLQCHLDYCASIWYPTLSSRLKNKLQVIQNKIVRYILNYNHREHVGQLELNSLNFLSVRDRVAQLLLNHVYSICELTSPVYLYEGFCQLSDIHGFQTRSSANNYFVSQVEGVETETFYYTAIKDWNCLPNEVKNISNYNRFQRENKRVLANQLSIEKIVLLPNID